MTDPHSLRDRPFHAGPGRILRLERRRLLRVTSRLQGLVGRLGADGQPSPSVGRRRAVRPKSAVSAGGSWEGDGHDRGAMVVLAAAPVLTVLSGGTDGLFGCPVDLEVTGREAPRRLGLPTGIERHRPDDLDPLVLARDQVVRIGIARIDQVHPWQEIPAGQGLLNDRQLGLVGVGRRCRLHIGNQVRGIRLTGFGDLDGVADPLPAPLGAVAGLHVIRGVDGDGRWREIPRRTPRHGRVGARELLQPDLPQRLDGRNRTEVGGRLRRTERLQQAKAIDADLVGQGIPLGLALGEAEVVDPRAIALGPRRIEAGSQPVGSPLGHLVQGMPQRLADQLQSVEGANGGQDRGRIGALASPCLQQPGGREARQHGLEQEQLRLAGNQSTAELRQHRGIEPGIGQLEGQGIFPVDATANGVGGLAIDEPFGVLQHEDQGQTPRSQGRTTTRGEERGKGGVFVEHPQVIAQPQAGITVREGRMSHARGFLGNGRNGSWLERHDDLPKVADRTETMTSQPPQGIRQQYP